MLASPAVELSADAGTGFVPESTSGEYLRIVRSHWVRIALSAVAGCLVAGLISWLETPLYRAHTLLEIQNINADFMNMKQARPIAEETTDSANQLMDVETQTQVLETAALNENTRNTLKKAGMKPEWQPQPSLWSKRQGQQQSAGSSSTSSSTLMDQILDKVGRSVKVKPIGDTRVIRIEVDAPSPVLAADYANTLVREYIQDNIKSHLQMTDEAEDLTRDQLVAMRRKLDTSEQDMQSYANAHKLIYTSERQNISDDRLRQLQSDLLHARADLADKDAQRQMSLTGKMNTLPQIVKDAELRQLQAKLIELRRHEAELLTIYKPEHDEVKKVRAQIAEMESDIGDESRKVVTGIDNEYLETKQKEETLNTAWNQAVQEAAVGSQAAVQYDMLKHDVDANLAAYQDLLGKAKELSLAAAFRTSNVRVIDAALPPADPHSPILPVNLGLGLASGLLLGVCLVLVQEHRNPNLRHPGEASMRLGIPELGTVLSADGGPRFGLLRRSTPALTPGHPAEPGTDSYKPVAADDFRTILASILFSKAPPKVITITSSAPQDGKTTVASNLASTLARAGRSVLLIDGDLRRPRMHTLFDVPNDLGFANLLESGADAAEAAKAVRDTSVELLKVLPSGSAQVAPADLLFQAELGRLLATFRSRFDMVIVDSPPMMRFPDARLLGKAADGVILIARSNKTSRNAIALACDRLRSDQTRLLGVVLNDWSGQLSPYPLYGSAHATLPG
jgi:capsular exopolysaccharide synthesis family protein